MRTSAVGTAFILSLTPVVALLVADAALLLRSPFLGVADILDFWRVMSPAGIEHVEPLERPGHFVRCTFATGPAELASAPSSSALLAYLARQVPWGLRPGQGLMDLRQMGLLLLALLALTAVLALRAGVPVLLVDDLEDLYFVYENATGNSYECLCEPIAVRRLGIGLYPHPSGSIDRERQVPLGELRERQEPGDWVHYLAHDAETISKEERS